VPVYTAFLSASARGVGLAGGSPGPPVRGNGPWGSGGGAYGLSALVPLEGAAAFQGHSAGVLMGCCRPVVGNSGQNVSAALLVSI